MTGAGQGQCRTQMFGTFKGLAGVAKRGPEREMDFAQDLMLRARTEFEGTQQSRSIVLFDEGISKLEGLRLQGSLPSRGMETLIEAYELRGRAYYLIGLQEKAADSFRALIELQPQYEMSKETVSPKIVSHFNSVKKSLVGYVAVSSVPPGARVTLDSEFLSLTDFFPLEVLAGEYTVEISREGYATETRTVSIAPRATETLSVELYTLVEGFTHAGDPPTAPADRVWAQSAWPITWWNTCPPIPCWRPAA